MKSENEDLTLKFINEVLNPLLEEYSFIDYELGGGKVAFGLISSFIEAMEMNGFHITQRETNELVLSYMLDELRSKLWKQKYF